MNKNTGGYGSKILGFSESFHLRDLIKALYPPAPFVNCISTIEKLYIQDCIFAKGNRILDVGSGLSKGPGAWLWKAKNISDCDIIRMDICDGDGVDIVADATSPPSSIGKFDSIIMQSVPEHVEDICKLVMEMKRLLNINGFIYVEMPFLQGVHADPDDYWRTTPQGLKVLFSPMKVIRSGVSGGVLGSLVWIFCDFVSNLSSSKILNLIIRFVIRWIASPLRYIDILIRDTQSAKRLSCENYILVKKLTDND